MITRRVMRGITISILPLILAVFATTALSRTLPDLETDHASGWWLAAGLGAGAVTPDQNLADYRWDTRPTTLFALQAIAGRGRLAAGLRLSRWAVTQGTGLARIESDPVVRMTHFEWIAQFQAIEFAGFQLWGSALAGRVGLSYAPDRVTIATGGPGGDIEVAFDPITETSLGWGLEIKRDFTGRMMASLAAEQSGFSLDTNHRRGSEIVSEREEFINWSIRLQVTWVLDLG